MEKIIITEISDELKTKTGDPFWGVTLSDKRKATVWDRQMAADIAMNLNWPTKGVVKAQGSFLNIREFNAERKATLQEVTKPVEPIKQAPISTGEFDHKLAEEISAKEFGANDAQIQEANNFEFEAKSSVKLKKMSKGMQWEVKVVKGEEKLITGLMEAAIVAHKALEVKFPEIIKVE